MIHTYWYTDFTSPLVTEILSCEHSAAVVHIHTYHILCYKTKFHHFETDTHSYARNLHKVVEFHQSWSGPCDCVKPLLYRVSTEKEEIKFCTAASDKVCYCFNMYSRGKQRFSDTANVQHEWWDYLTVIDGVRWPHCNILPLCLSRCLAVRFSSWLLSQSSLPLSFLLYEGLQGSRLKLPRTICVMCITHSYAHK